MNNRKKAKKPGIPEVENENISHSLLHASHVPQSLAVTSFEELVSAIVFTDTSLSSSAAKAVNIALTQRNWLIGLYIEKFELKGADRAQYGQNLLNELSSRLKKQNISNSRKRQLYYYLRFYRLYPQIVRSVSALLPVLSLIDEVQKVRSVTAQSQAPSIIENIAEFLSYTHIEQILQIEDDLKRRFYEVEAIQGNWSVRELKRQICSLYFERSGLSTDKSKLSEYVAHIAEKQPSELTIRDPFIFEFLKLKSQEVMYESDLEEAILKNLQEFLLELGHGFCFEARQKRILIGDEYYYIDLVFYNRILKCHILIDLKVDEFTHEYLGQLNTYVNWYKQNVMREGDNPPIGILLCTQKNHPLVEYALAGMSNQIFVSKYQTELPKSEEIAQFIDEKIKAFKGNLAE